MATKAKKFIDVLTPGIVRLIAPNTKQREKSFFITPIEDAITREFVTGSEFDEAKEKEDGKNAKQLAEFFIDIWPDHTQPDSFVILLFTVQICIPDYWLTLICLFKRKNRSHH